VLEVDDMVNTDVIRDGQRGAMTAHGEVEDRFAVRFPRARPVRGPESGIAVQGCGPSEQHRRPGPLVPRQVAGVIGIDTGMDNDPLAPSDEPSKIVFQQTGRECLSA
jgi:hypothetical protein